MTNTAIEIYRNADGVLTVKTTFPSGWTDVQTWANKAHEVTMPAWLYGFSRKTIDCREEGTR